MIRRCIRIGLWLGLLGGIAFAVARLLAGRAAAPTVPPGTATEPWPPLPDLPEPAVSSAAWVEATNGACPASHPVKGKLSSKIYHLPGMANYERTRPDRCYATAADAEADGLRPAKR